VTCGMRCGNWLACTATRSQHEPALDYLRQVLALQPDAEEKAAMGLAEAMVATQDEDELVAQALRGVRRSEG